MWRKYPKFWYRPHSSPIEKPKARPTDFAHHLTPAHQFISSALSTCHFLHPMPGPQTRQDTTLAIRNKHQPCLHDPYSLTADGATSRNLELVALNLLLFYVTADSVKISPLIFYLKSILHCLSDYPSERAVQCLTIFIFDFPLMVCFFKCRKTSGCFSTYFATPKKGKCHFKM